jgi:type IV fimbrial biogenesis protein FimT
MDNSRGFTLIELIVVLAVLALFVTEAVPGFRRLIAHERRSSAVLSLVRALRFARGHAISSNRYIAVCKSMDGAHCGGTGLHWDDGWIVFANDDRDSPPQLDDDEMLLRRHPPLADPIMLTANRGGFNFRPRSINSTAGSLFVCAQDQPGEAVIVSVTGRVRVSPDYDGAPVDCN